MKSVLKPPKPLKPKDSLQKLQEMAPVFVRDVGESLSEVFSESNFNKGSSLVLASSSASSASMTATKRKVTTSTPLVSPITEEATPHSSPKKKKSFTGFVLPYTPSRNIKEAKEKLREARVRRDNSTKESDELFLLTQHFRLRDMRDMGDLEEERERRIKAEKRVEELVKENLKLKQALKAMLDQ